MSQSIFSHQQNENLKQDQFHHLYFYSSLNKATTLPFLHWGIDQTACLLESISLYRKVHLQFIKLNHLIYNI